MSRVRGFRCAAVAAAVTVLVAGCGGFGASARDVVEGAAPETPVPFASPTPTPDDVNPPRRYLTVDQIREALVGEKAFPVDWQVRVVPEGTDTSAGFDSVYDPPECEKTTDLFHVGYADIPATGSAVIVALSPDNRIFSSVTVAAFGSGDAARLIAQIRGLVARCAAYTETQTVGKNALEVTTVPIRRLGDEAFAMAVATRPELSPSGWANTAAVVRIGDVLVVVTSKNRDDPTPEMPDEDLLRRQVDRVKAVLAGKPVPGA